MAGEVPGCLDDLAETQAHIEDIRLAWETLWQELLETAALDAVSGPGAGLSGRNGNGNSDHMPEVSTAAGTSCLARDKNLDSITRRLSSLTGYQRRAAGRRRMLVLEVLRWQAQQSCDRTQTVEN
jgi:hypothetical protein